MNLLTISRSNYLNISRNSNHHIKSLLHLQARAILESVKSHLSKVTSTMSGQNHGQSRFTLLDKLKPKSCLKAKKDITLMTPEAHIPFPPPPPPPPFQTIPVPPPAPPPPAKQDQAKRSDSNRGSSKKHANHNATTESPQSTRQSRHVTFQRPVNTTIGPNNHGSPGYIRVEGGTRSSYGFNNYDAHLPLAELIGASPEQQFAILGAIPIGRVGSGYGYNHGNNYGHGEMGGRLSGGQFIPDHHHAYASNYIPPQNQRAITVAPHSHSESHPQPRPQLTLPAPAPKPASKSHSSHRSNKTGHGQSGSKSKSTGKAPSSHHSDETVQGHSHSNSNNSVTSSSSVQTLPLSFPTETPILDRYLKSLAPPPGFQLMPIPTSSPTPITTTAVTPASAYAKLNTELQCCVCHAIKDPYSNNVKRLSELGDLSLCWRCLHAQIGPDAGVCWFRTQVG